MPERIAVSTRVRLARNFADLPFPACMNADDAREAVERVKRCLKEAELGPVHLLDIAQLSQNARYELVEQHKISPALARDERGAIAELLDGHAYVMVNEEDHIRIQVIWPGLQLREAMEQAVEVDKALERGVYAFDEDWGYLTACPSNLGTGLRVSVMLHLPALAITGRIQSIVDAANKAGLTVRGQYGEGSEATGNLYQLSNQVCLGVDEREITMALHEAAQQVVDMELEARKRLQARNAIGLEDRLMRSYGVLRTARRMDAKEFMRRLSDLRLAVDLGYLPYDQSDLDTLLLQAQPAALRRLAGRSLDREAENIERARRFRESMDALDETLEDDGAVGD